MVLTQLKTFMERLQCLADHWATRTALKGVFDAHEEPWIEKGMPGSAKGVYKATSGVFQGALKSEMAALKCMSPLPLS